MSGKRLVFTTFPDPDQALATADRLIREKLAACVNILPQMTSVYEWNGEVHRDIEYLMLIKTSDERYHALEAAIRETHPYELPEIIATPISHGLAAYLSWIDEQTSPGDQ